MGVSFLWGEMGYGQGLSAEEVRRKRAETKKRWRERNPEKWRAMRAAQKQRYLDRKRGPGRVRGLLCNLCNRGLGFMRDSQRNLLRAVEYLQANDLGPWEADGCAA